MIISAILAANDGGLHSAAVQTAIIGGSFTLIGLLLSFVLDKPRRIIHPTPPVPGPTEDEDDDELVDELRRRAERAEHELRVKTNEAGRYRDLLLTNGIDPDTGVMRPLPHRSEP